MKIRISISILFFSLFLTSWCAAASNNKGYEVEKIGANSYVLTYAWSQSVRTNIGVVEGEQGFLLINTMMIGQVEELEQALVQIADKPVQYVINSNSDWYNTSANKYFADKGATIISHRDAVYNLNTYTQILFTDEIELEVGGETVTATHSKAHSAGHVNVHLKQANAIFVADSYSPRWAAPLGPNGIEGHLDNLKNIIKLSDQHTSVIPGNIAKTKIANKADVIHELNTRTKLYNRVSQLQSSGKDSKEVIKDEQVQNLLSTYEEYAKWKNETWLVDRIKFHNLKGRQKQTKMGLQAYVGNYTLPDGREILVFEQDNNLYAKAEGIFYLQLASAGADTFWFNSENFSQKMQFVRNDNQQVSEIKVEFEPDSEHHLRKLGTLKILKSM